jgi:hypothetical protein
MIRGSVAGSYMHLIDRIAEPADGRIRPTHIRPVDDASMDDTADDR